MLNILGSVTTISFNKISLFILFYFESLRISGANEKGDADHKKTRASIKFSINARFSIDCRMHEMVY